MKFVYFLLTVAFGLAAAKDGEPLPEKSYQVSCAFRDTLCGWTNNQSLSGIFSVASNDKINNPSKGCKYLYLKRNGEKTGSILASMESPEFMTLPNMIVLQVNFSYWIRSYNQTAQLKLLLIPFEGPFSGTEINIWNTGVNQEQYLELWNQTIVNIKKTSANKLKLVLQGSIGSLDDVIAINEIKVVEITTNEVADIGILPDSISKYTNSTCENNASILKQSSLVLLAILAVSLTVTHYNRIA